MVVSETLVCARSCSSAASVEEVVPAVRVVAAVVCRPTLIGASALSCDRGDGVH